MLASYLLEISKINVCVIRLNSIGQNGGRCLYNECLTANSISPEETQTQNFKLSLNPYLPCCIVCDESDSPEAARPWKLCGSRAKSSPWSPTSKKSPNVIVVRYFRSHVRPGVATLYPTKHKCIPRKNADPGSKSLNNKEIEKQRGLSAGKIKLEMRKLAFKIKKDQWAKKTSDTLIVRPDKPSRKADPITLPAPKLNEAWGQNDNKVLFESKSLKELKQRITKKKPKDSSPVSPLAIRMTASSSTDSQTSGVPSRYVILSESKTKEKDTESSTENKGISLPSPYFFIDQTLNKESLKGTYSDPSLVKEIKNKNKKTEEKPKDLKDENIVTPTPSPRLLPSGNEGGSTGVNILHHQIQSALKYTQPHKTAQDFLGTLTQTKEETLKDNPVQKNSSYPSPSLKYSGVFSTTRENVSRSSSHVWPDENALTPAAPEVNSFKKKSNNQLTVGYDDYLRRKDKDIRQKRISKTVTKEVVVFKDDKNRQDLTLIKLPLTKETNNPDQPKTISNDLKISSYPSPLTPRDNVDNKMTTIKSHGPSSDSNTLPDPNNIFSSVIKDIQPTSALQKTKVQDQNPLLDKPLNNCTPVLKKDMHSKSSNSGDENERVNLNGWELQIHTNKNTTTKSDDRKNDSIGDYIIAEEGLPSGKKVLHLYSKRVLEVSSPVIDGNEKNQATSGRRLILGKSKVASEEEPVESSNVRELNKNEARNQKEIYTIQDSSHKTYPHINPNIIPVEEPIESPNYGELIRGEARNHKEGYIHPHSHTKYLYNKPNISPVEDPVKFTNYRELNQNETDRYPQSTSSQSAYHNEVHSNPGHDDNIETHRDYSDPMPSTSLRREFNPRVPVHGQFAPYYPSNSDFPASTVNDSYSKFDRKLSNLSFDQTTNNSPPPPTFYGKNIQETDQESTHPWGLIAETNERRQHHLDLHSKHSSQEMQDIYSSDHNSHTSSNDQGLEPKNPSNPSAIIHADRTQQRRSPVENLDSNFNPNSDYLGIEFRKPHKESPAIQSSVVNANPNKSGVQLDTNKILYRRKKSNDEKSHHSYTSQGVSQSSFHSADPSKCIQSSQTPKRFESVNKGKEKESSISSDDRALNNIVLKQKHSFDITKLVREKVKRNRDVFIESEITQKVDNKAFEYTMAEESKRSFEELKKLVNEQLHLQGSKTELKQGNRVLHGKKRTSEATMVSPPSVKKRNSKVFDVKHDYSKDNVSRVETKTKSSIQDSPTISSLNRKSLRNSYYHIGKAKSCLETFLDNVIIEQGNIHSSQTSFGSNKNNVSEYKEAQTLPKFNNHQKKVTKIINFTPKEVSQNTSSPEKSFKISSDTLTNKERKNERVQPTTLVKPVVDDPPKESTINSNFEKNIAKSVGIVNQFKSKSEKIKGTPGEKVSNGNSLQVWDTSAVNIASPNLQRKQDDSYNHYKNRNDSTTFSNNVDPHRSDTFQDPSRSVTSPHFNPPTFYSPRSDQSSNAVKTPYSVLPSSAQQNQGQTFPMKHDAPLNADAMRAYKYAYDYYHDYYSKPNATGAIDSIPPNLLNDTYLLGLEEANYSNTQDSSHHNRAGLDRRSSHSIISPSPDFSNLIDSNADTNSSGNYLPNFNAPENITYSNSHHNYWSTVTARNSVNQGMSKHYSHSLGPNYNATTTETVKTHSQGLEMPRNSVNVHPARQYPYGQLEAANTVNSYDFRAPASNLNTNKEKNYSYRGHHQKKSTRHPNLHSSYRPGVPDHTMNADVNKNTGYEQSINSEAEIEKLYFSNESKNKSSVTDNYSMSGQVEIDASKYSPSGLRVYNKELRGLSDVQLDARVAAVDEKTKTDFKENIKIVNVPSNHVRGKILKSSEQSAMSPSRKKHTRSELVMNKFREASSDEPNPPEFIFNVPDSSKKGFSFLDLPKNLSGYFQKIVSWKNTHGHNYGEGDFSRDVVGGRHTPKEKHPSFAEIPSNKENSLEKFTKPILESINRNVDSYYVKSVFVNNPIKSISKVAFARRIANVGPRLDPDDGNCTACMKLSKLTSSIQTGVPFLKSKKMEYNFAKGYISSNNNSNDSTDVVKEIDNTEEKSQNLQYSNSVKKPEQSDKKLFNNYSMSIIPTKSRVPAEYDLHEDLKAEDLSYLNPYITKRPMVINPIKPNVKTKLKAITEKKQNSSDKKQVIKMPKRSKVTYVTKNLTNKLKSAMSKSNLVTKPIEGADLKSIITAKPEMSDSKEREVIKKKNGNNSASNIENTPISAADPNKTIPQVNAEVQQEPIVATEKKKVSNKVKTSSQSVGKSISDIIMASSRTITSKIKQSNSAKVKSAEAIKINVKSPQVEQSFDADNGSVVNSASKKFYSTKSWVNDLKNLSSDKKDNPYKAFSDLYSN